MLLRCLARLLKSCLFPSFVRPIQFSSPKRKVILYLCSTLKSKFQIKIWETKWQRRRKLLCANTSTPDIANFRVNANTSTQKRFAASYSAKQKGAPKGTQKPVDMETSAKEGLCAFLSMTPLSHKPLPLPLLTNPCLLPPAPVLTPPRRKWM